ncbi:DUF4352 domain-containing protein [Bacillus altitudinis]|uniref:DUF4352 domain-containing protein n=1 Tax=Bacillus TaxID=1386 RepID=UPI0024A7C5C5|nr:DUF4352 domain-containing protein [Bacillus altitudinis]MDI6647933.1 DUF4352 domain-containing protein [Bacillus altitudinis]MDI6662557.1 DUF4352 domain-containing protein [Bacillus altitudinis]
MKRKLTLFVVLLLTVALSACNAQSSNTKEEEKGKQDTNASSESSSKQESKKKADGTRSAPIPLKEPLMFEDYIMTQNKEYTATLEMIVKEVIRGDKAFDILYKTNSSNSKPNKGYEYALVKVNVKMTDSETDDEPILFSPILNFDFFSSDGSPYSQELGIVVTKKFEGEVYKGGSLEGYIVNQVKKDDDFLIAYKSMSTSGKLFFKTK